MPRRGSWPGQGGTGPEIPSYGTHPNHRSQQQPTPKPKRKEEKKKKQKKKKKRGEEGRKKRKKKETTPPKKPTRDQEKKKKKSFSNRRNCSPRLQTRAKVFTNEKSRPQERGQKGPSNNSPGRGGGGNP